MTIAAQSRVVGPHDGARCAYASQNQAARRLRWLSARTPNGSGSRHDRKSSRVDAKAVSHFARKDSAVMKVIARGPVADTRAVTTRLAITVAISRAAMKRVAATSAAGSRPVR